MENETVKIKMTMENGGVVSLELYPDIAPCHIRIYDPGR